MVTEPSILAGESMDLVGYSPQGRKESDTTEQLSVCTHTHTHTHTHIQDAPVVTYSPTLTHICIHS